ncbi:hypothetical protein [Thermophilibacter provencensis]|uniref:Uncharacterized protein n=1 Tax=Thermophilibacter provencensis TaxID=1852386 RepID=A0ABT7V3C5_9ACTN|nr:hypothetical protein [Thermophilibacter provencensis]MDM8271093.1 hypothetical protein [Thermophilibacter provencensis]
MAVAVVAVVLGLALVVPTILKGAFSQPAASDEGEEPVDEQARPLEHVVFVPYDAPADEDATDEDPSQLTGDGIVLLNSFETTGNYNDASHAFELFSQAAGLGDVEAEYYLG